MKRTLRQAAFTMATLALTVSVAAAAPALPNFVPLAKSAGPAVVNISTEREVSTRMGGGFPGMPPGMERFFEEFGPFWGQPQGPRKQSSLGSGFIISSDGYIVTNNHVVEGADKVFVNLEGDSDRAHSLEAAVVGTDAETDIALLKVDAKRDLPVLNFGNSDTAEVGEWVVAIGNPFGLSNSVTAGILSAKGRDIHAGPFDNFLQTDASINPGNSGGPLINMAGEVIGINTAIVASGQGIGFAIPSNLASRIVEELKSGKKISRGWLGVTIQDVDENAAKALGLKDAQGALIGSVLPDEPAAKAGLKAGDIIVRVGRDDIRNSTELLRSVADLKPGTDVKITVLRNGKEFSTTVKLGERASQGMSQGGAQEEGGTSLGLTIRPLNKEDARSLQLPANTEGLVILSVQPGSPAQEAGLRPGDVIQSANLTPVVSVDELASIVRKDGRERGAVMLQVNRRGESFFVTVPLDNK
ncbi:MAG: peptidase [Desulfovibrionaceae bacterium]|nr:DegQ family serine endoprotease [Desulfovibrionaceae bacterium]PWM71051.1 MAG: peptidase [Desulfovibrionaceae bacterium]